MPVRTCGPAFFVEGFVLVAKGSGTMGLFDGITSMISGAMGGGDNNAVADQVMGVLQQHGINGVSGLVSQFQSAGLGEHVASWVGTGDNLPIDAASIQTALGTPVIASLAAKFGVDPATASQLLAQHLPGVVNAATPGGQVPS
jgi:uncharacterized protein YidB (DUF937 family)